MARWNQSKFPAYTAYNLNFNRRRWLIISMQRYTGECKLPITAAGVIEIARPLNQVAMRNIAQQHSGLVNTSATADAALCGCRRWKFCRVASSPSLELLAAALRVRRHTIEELLKQIASTRVCSSCAKND